jgi:hypothetical protein
MGGRRVRADFAVRGGVLPPRLDSDAEEESPAVSESNLVTNDASARRSSSSCCRACVLPGKKKTCQLTRKLGWGGAVGRRMYGWIGG